MTENGDERELPEGWVRTTIGAVSERATKVQPKDDPDGEFTYIDISSIDNDLNRITEPKRYKGSDAPSRARQLVREGDTLLSTVRVYLKNTAIVTERHDGDIATTGFCVIRPVSADSKYVYYFTLSDGFVASLAEHQRGVSYPAVRDGDVFQESIPLAPLAEQRRIVDKIEELFSDLDAGVKALETVRRQLDRYRQSVLKAAVEGDLTREWRDQHGADAEPADALLERILDERRARWEADYAAKYEAKGKTPPKGWQSRYKEPEAPDTADVTPFPDSWEWVSMDSLTQEITSGPRNWSPYYDRGEGVFVMAQNVRPVHLDLTYEKRVDPPDDDPGVERSQIERDDLLVTIVGANTGDVCRVDRELPQHYVCQSVALMRAVLTDLSRYLNLYLNSAENGQRQWRRYIYGAGRPHLSFDQLRMTGVALPPLAEQEAIVEKVDERLSVVDAVAAEVDRQLARAGRLRRAILQHAFDGKLVPQEARVNTDGDEVGERVEHGQGGHSVQMYLELE